MTGRTNQNLQQLFANWHYFNPDPFHAVVAARVRKLNSNVRFLVAHSVQSARRQIDDLSYGSLMVIEELGPGVANAWNHLRPATKNLIEKAWQSAAGGTAQQIQRPTQFDPRADQELNQLLAALDEHAQQIEQASGRESAREARRLADACATVLSHQTQSAEVFSRLIARAHQRKNFAKVDTLAALLIERLAPSELCDLARASNVVVRALAHEALAQLPTPLLAALLRDPVDVAVARQALERQATEFDSKDAQRVLREFIDRFDENFD